jgi:hypothetical protein
MVRDSPQAATAAARSILPAKFARTQGPPHQKNGGDTHNGQCDCFLPDHGHKIIAIRCFATGIVQKTAVIA